ncbi:nuclear transport factor 2 family protein [Variovorax ginsengisoli]|uniref:Nuclear transport factor 2 family protein n=1 Tax=Variovorax ginsengisoli TaxID=363844 RepID=A0ABT8S9L8_9BURK|nr:nuclear transport factor 2 family protein [Variovorax ginsengisoli]MDN8616436.1 nuclear transport factor 2 family protein [Variovorax ginsengisoli]MDO1535606.1 nuclear transport factor 2 family protein [Variovorax ginsengisoli]
MTEIVRQILLADELRRNALVAADVEALGALLSPELRFVHTTAAVDDRDSLMRKVSTGALRYREIELLHASVDVFDGFAVQWSDLKMSVLSSGLVKTIHCRALATWTMADGAWALRHYQATLIAS